MFAFFYCVKQHPMLTLHTHITSAPINRTMRSRGFFYYYFQYIIAKLSLSLFIETYFFSAFRYQIRGSLGGGGHSPQPHSDIFHLSCGMQRQLKRFMKKEEVGQKCLTPFLVVGLHCYWWSCRFQNIFKRIFSCSNICLLLYSQISCQVKGHVLQGSRKIPHIIFRLEIISAHFAWLASMV